jgi:hypothetical protein
MAACSRVMDGLVVARQRGEPRLGANGATRPKRQDAGPFRRRMLVFQLHAVKSWWSFQRLRRWMERHGMLLRVIVAPNITEKSVVTCCSVGKRLPHQTLLQLLRLLWRNAMAPAPQPMIAHQSLLKMTSDQTLDQSRLTKTHVLTTNAGLVAS